MMDEALVTLGAFVIIIGLIFFLVLIALLVFYFIGAWKMFKKAGHDGWKCLIPYYSDYVMMVDIAGLHVGYFIALIAMSLLSGLVGFIPGFLTGLGVDMGVFAYIFNVLSWLFNIASIMLSVALAFNLSKKFNKGTGWVVLTIFFSIITIPLLGFSKKDEYKDVEVSKHSVFAALIK